MDLGREWPVWANARRRRCHLTFANWISVLGINDASTDLGPKLIRALALGVLGLAGRLSTIPQETTSSLRLDSLRPVFMRPS
jgi:hypothetical protein